MASTSIELAPGVSVPLLDFATQGNAVLGIRDSGKSYTASGLGEKLLDAGIPWVAFDPIGVWRYLKVPGDGRNAHGYPVVVAGDNADIPLHPDTAADLVRAAMKEGVSLVIDLYSLELSKADWRRVVESSIRVLLYENRTHGPRHIFIEEAAEFCPQKLGPETGRVYAEVEKLARMGGNAGLGYTLINQRPEEVNKAVLELCDCLFLHRQKGRNSLASLQKWLELADSSKSREITISLPKLDKGQCWIWAPGTSEPICVKIPAKRSYHPDRRASHALRPRSTPTNVAPFVARMAAHLSELASKRSPATAAAPSRNRRVSSDKPGPDPRDAVIAELRRQLAVASEPSIVNVPAVSPEEFANLTKLSGTLSSLTDSIKTATDRLIGALESVAKQKASPAAAKPPMSIPKLPQGHREPIAHTQSNGAISGGARRMMIAIAQRPGLSLRQVGLRAGISSKSGTFRTYLSRLRQQGWIDGSMNGLSPTTVGLKELGRYEPLPAGAQLRDYWLRQPQLSGGAGRMLRALADAYPSPLSAQQLGEISGVTSESGTFRTYLSRLRTLELIEGNAGALRASAELFD